MKYNIPNILDVVENNLSHHENKIFREYLDGEKLTDVVVKKLAISRSQILALFIA